MVIDRFRYVGQPVSEWPRWLIGRNYAAASDGSYLVIHGFLDVMRVPNGATLLLLATMEIELGDE